MSLSGIQERLTTRTFVFANLVLARIGILQAEQGCLILETFHFSEAFGHKICPPPFYENQA